MEDFDNIPLKIKETIDFVFEYASTINVWMDLKKQLMRNLAHEHHRCLSTRDPYTKFQFPNELELTIMHYWVSKTNKPLHYKAGKIEYIIQPNN